MKQAEIPSAGFSADLVLGSHRLNARCCLHNAISVLIFKADCCDVWPQVSLTGLVLWSRRMGA